MSKRVLLADDHTIMRAGLRNLLERQSDMEVIGEAGNGREAVKLARELSPDVIVMDISMPELNGIEATRQIINATPSAKILILSVHSDERFVANVLAAGAAGYLLKNCAIDELVLAIQTVCENQTYLSTKITDVLVKDYVKQLTGADSRTRPGLSPRECEVLQLLAEGKTTKQIAASLYLSPKTVESHRRQVMEKLDIHSIAELTKYAIRAGFTSLEP
ncbi:MAG: response regulator transcription factor [Planctomycetota bacterium]|nr:MAG: response regulator transcription factor [Planctomycetota bacterium]